MVAISRCHFLDCVYGCQFHCFLLQISTNFYLLTLLISNIGFNNSILKLGFFAKFIEIKKYHHFFFFCWSVFLSCWQLPGEPWYCTKSATTPRGFPTLLYQPRVHTNFEVIVLYTQQMHYVHVILFYFTKGCYFLNMDKK